MVEKVLTVDMPLYAMAIKQAHQIIFISTGDGLVIIMVFSMLDSLNPGSSNFGENQDAIIGIEPNTSDTLYQIYKSFENWAWLGWRNINNNNDDDSLEYFSEILNPTIDLAHSGEIGVGICTNSGADDWAVTNKIFFTKF